MRIFRKSKIGLLIGAGWVPDEYLINEARNFGAFKNCKKIKCIEGPSDLNKQVAIHMYLLMEKKENWSGSKNGIAYNELNMGSGKIMWAVYPQ